MPQLACELCASSVCLLDFGLVLSVLLVAIGIVQLLLECLNDLLLGEDRLLLRLELGLFLLQGLFDAGVLQGRGRLVGMD